MSHLQKIPSLRNARVSSCAASKSAWLHTTTVISACSVSARAAQTANRIIDISEAHRVRLFISSLLEGRPYESQRPERLSRGNRLWHSGLRSFPTRFEISKIALHM